ncbi:SIMPL domain-containing protein [Pseudomonas sp. CCI3.2]|uniref:SIMPL domain-containing protein n=1 Tax=unclassified Pseudomonas TaxID=196821 RepID=UPI002AC9041B|nr:MULTISPECIES: SIMPL domain-containing protein [unclassified Pseudomonas]MEB0078225.1 SIMPL domain-containing protein [Pseudomonas sp. MH10out]MEB0093110.1 SIMPL domain-containing protein [Pseudomonas sp. CCI4.2]MEB0100013.1 SIMPL domain-containing protein [Pseudomonas sp. CCI3.2]MEB0129875.1 SIMPL domain-containing protein [Pseudomonas sp. CCI2.4]MEB0157760.1 SIMPL domain-containing protein [Pseudomonas sp. AH2 (2023)]
MFSLRPAAALIALGVVTFASLPAMADEPRYNQVSVRAEVSQEVPRDLMMVTLFTEAQNTDPAKLATEITESLNKALGQAREVKGVTIRQGARNSSPIYDDKGQKITGWREHAELRLESADFAALSKLTATLLDGMKISSMDFAIAPPTRKASEDSLLKDAVTAFKARAQLVTDALGGKSYKLVNLNLNTSGFPQPYLRAPVMMMKAARSDAAPTPDVEAGTSQVSVNADGVIEVQMQ